jgi:hypothetical protein
VSDTSGGDSFEPSRVLFDSLVAGLEGDQASQLTHAELEDRLGADGRQLLRQLLEDHLDLRAEREARIEVVIDANGVVHGAVEAGHVRMLTSVFGQVHVTRLAYRHRGAENLHPADADLNLPQERHSHGLRRLAATEAARGSFDEAAAAITRSTGQAVGKRQVEELTERAGADVEKYYSVSPRHRTKAGDVVVLSADAKGIVMRPDALREATAKAAADAENKLATRLSKGEKRNRTRMAEVGSVYEVTPVPRTSADIMAPDDETEVTPGPRAMHKWLTASVANDAAAVVASLFDEAQRRDPRHRREWIALVDGNNHQIQRIETESAERKVNVTILVDFVHVLEYLWKAAWSFFDEGDPGAERWVHDKATAVLHGQASTVAAAIGRKATCLKLAKADRANADLCVKYLLAKRDYLDYSGALANGWPIATGIIEGACRHLVKDGLDLTGARWGLDGAETILKLRAVRSNGDFDDYWNFHLAQERQRVHQSRYADHVIPQAA